MFQRFHAMREEREGGFTLIELLVVILIIAILAAIAIPVFLRQREKGWIGQMESSLKNAATAAESYATGDGDGGYTGLTSPVNDPEAGTLADEGWNPTDEVDLTVRDATDTYFCFSVVHDRYDGDQEPMYYTSESGRPVGDVGSCTVADDA
jgi:type IV pilus assembly protein PilA